MADPGIDRLSPKAKADLALEIRESLGQERPVAKLDDERTAEPARRGIGSRSRHRFDLGADSGTGGVRPLSLPLVFHPDVAAETDAPRCINSPS